MKLSDEDRLEIEKLKTFGVLDDIESHRLDQSEGAITVWCADGDQLVDIFTYHAKTQEGQRQNARIHALGWNGGALRLVKNSTTNKPGRTADLDFLEDIYDASEMKGIKTVVLYAHAPCGKAKACGLTFYEIISMLMSAKRRIKEEKPDFCVACFCHIDFGDGVKKTYFVSKEMWKKYRTEKSLFVCEY